MTPRRHPTPAVARAGASLLVALALAGCGAIANTFTPAPHSANHVTIELAGAPNALYAGFYEAQALGYFKQTDLDVRFQIPARGQNPLTMLHDGRVLLAVASEPSVFLQRNLNEPVAGIAALLHAPLNTIRITLPAATPTGDTAPVTGAPAHGRRKSSRSKRVVSAPAVTTVPAPVTQVWPAKLRQLLAAPGAPTYDGLTVAVRAETITDRSGVLRRFIQALARGYRAARADPAQAVSKLIAANPALAPRRRYELAMLKAALPEMFPPGLRVWGFQREAQWNAFGTWMTTNHVLTNPNAVSSASTNQLLQGQGI